MVLIHRYEEDGDYEYDDYEGDYADDAEEGEEGAYLEDPEEDVYAYENDHQFGDTEDESHAGRRVGRTIQLAANYDCHKSKKTSYMDIMYCHEKVAYIRKCCPDKMNLSLRYLLQLSQLLVRPDSCMPFLTGHALARTSCHGTFTSICTSTMTRRESFV